MKRFVVGVQGMNKNQEQQFIEYLRDKRFGWWHWMDNFWLLAANRDDVEASEIRDAVHEIGAIRRCIVIDVQPNTWSGWRDDPKMFDWVKKTWPTE